MASVSAPAGSSTYTVLSAALTESTFAPASTATAEAAPSGFAARRNDSCLPAEVDCFFTELPFVACCPLGLVCARQFNAVCCPDPSNCTQTLIGHPGCANRTWNLYDNGGYFCCDPGDFGYAFGTGSGCAQSEASIPEFSVKLPVLQSGLPAKAFPTTTTPSSTEQTSAATSSPPASSSTNTGAIAGGVVGGVVGLILVAVAIWFLLRWRRKKHAPTPTPATAPPRDGYGVAYEDTKSRQEKGNYGVAAVPPRHRNPGEPLHELPSPTPPPASAGRSWLSLEPTGPHDDPPRELP